MFRNLRLQLLCALLLAGGCASFRPRSEEAERAAHPLAVLFGGPLGCLVETGMRDVAEKDAATAPGAPEASPEDAAGN